jgi:hypothetical protein
VDDADIFIEVSGTTPVTAPASPCPRRPASGISVRRVLLATSPPRLLVICPRLVAHPVFAPTGCYPAGCKLTACGVGTRCPWLAAWPIRLHPLDGGSVTSVLFPLHAATPENGHCTCTRHTCNATWGVAMSSSHVSGPFLLVK